MIPAAFSYEKPGSVDEAVAALGRLGEEAKLLAGGQSLLTLLRLRLVAPTALVDLGGIPALRGVRDDGDALVIGAMTTHTTVMSDPLIRQHTALLAAAAATVGDPAVRNRGTLGGSLANADPAGDLPSAAVALDAELVVAGPNGTRTIPVSEFFVDYLQTALAPDEVLVEVRVPKLAGWGVHYEKFNRVAQAWPVVGVAAAVRRSNGSIAEARVALAHMAPTPIRAGAVERALAGADGTKEAITAAAASAADGTSPTSDVSAQADYREHLARVLTGRAVAAAAGL
jgi:aerobic carbon-monoxide dehydrogenase medium subunit